MNTKKRVNPMLPPFQLVPEPASDVAAAAFGKMMKAEHIGKRHRLGGQPEFIESDDTPKCRFGKLMSFYAQLDSISEEYMLADRGMIYVFVCFYCFETKAVLQSH